MNQLRYKLAFVLFRLSMWVVGLSHQINPYLRNSEFADNAAIIQRYRKWSKGQER